MKATDALITKHQWNALRDTDLEHELRMRFVKTIVLGGIATNSESNLPRALARNLDLTSCLSKMR